MAWYYAQDGQQRGPIELPQLHGMFASGQLNGQDLVWTEGMAQWQPAASVQAVMPAGPARPAPPPQQVPAGPGAPQVTPLQPAYFAFEPPSRHAGLAMTSLILSVLGVVLAGPLLSIPGAICGHVALKGMRQTGDLRNQGVAQAGFWIGLIVSLFWGLILLIFLIIVIVAIIVGATGH